MKFNKFQIAVVALAAVAFVGCKNEDLSEKHYDNKLYISATNFTDELLIKNSIKTSSRDISVGIAMPVAYDIEVTFKAAPELLDTYKRAYYDSEAILLGEEHYKIDEPKTVIKAGSVSGMPVTVDFVDTDVLDRETRYVLPVTIASVSGMDVLPTARTVYYIFKGAALINVVANLSQNYFTVNWASNVSGLKTLTIEALIRVSDFGTVGGKKGEAMSTLFGIEGTFLIRLGDSGYPQNQIQVVKSGSKNWPAGDSTHGLPTNEWVHVAVVWDATTGDRIIYHNGKVIDQDTGASGSVSLTSGCHIGYAWNDSRWLEGDIAEMRIWNVQRTPEEIQQCVYEVDPTTPGMIAYWKFDEGAGDTVHDRTGNGNDVKANSELKWVPVSLPESTKK